MQKTVIALALAACFAAPAFAQSAAPASEHSLTGNVGLFSSYRFRGIDQTFGKPALQGGFDYSHASGLYAGNWNSNVSSGAGFPDGNLEMDFYGGYKMSLGDFGVDVGGIYYYYPGTDLAGKKIKNGEIYVGGSWKIFSAKYYHAVTDYFNVDDTRGTGYLDLGATYDLGNGWGINGHVGRLDVKHSSDLDYTDWKVGVTKDINGWVLGAAYVGTNAKGDCGRGELYCFANSLDSAGNVGNKFKDAGRDIVVLSISKTF